jgi:hypothetical protein
VGSEALRRGIAERFQRARALLTDAFERGGWSVERDEGHRAVFVVSRQGTAYAVELKVGAEGRPDRLIPLLSQAILEAQRAAPRRLRPLAVVAAPRIAPRAAKQILRFGQEHAPDVAAGILDFEGLRLFEGPGLESLVAPLPHSPALASRPQAGPGHLFTDLNQWMLKVLLAPELPSRLLAAPRGDYRNASELARAAGVSVMTAYRLVELLKNEGFLHESEPSLTLVRRRVLFSRWQASGRRSPPEEPQRFVLRGDLLRQLEGFLKGRHRACLGLFAAARALNLGLVEGVPPFIYVEHLRGASRSPSKQLRPCGPGESPDLILRKPLAAESVFRSMVRAGAVPASDVVQIWLDVSTHPTRGEEQANLIYDRVLRPVVEREA